MGFDSGTEQDLAFEYTHGPSLYPNIAGVIPEVRDYEGHRIRIRLPFNYIHKNHVNVMYAGSLFVLAEIAGGSMFEVTFGSKDYVPVIHSGSIRYKAPCATDAIVDCTMSEEDFQELKKSIDERGRGRVPFQLEIRDTEGNLCCESEMTVYALPAGTSLA